MSVLVIHLLHVYASSFFIFNIDPNRGRSQVIVLINVVNKKLLICVKIHSEPLSGYFSFAVLDKRMLTLAEAVTH